MTEEELRGLLNELERSLSETDLSPLVDQERITAREGKAETLTQEDATGLRRERARQGLKRTSDPRAGDARVRPLDSGERLAQLLDLLEIAIGGSYAIETRLRQYLKQALDGSSGEHVAHEWSGQVVFATSSESELEESGQGEWFLPDQDELERREPAVRRVIQLIQQLRAVADLPRSKYLRLSSNDSNADFDPEFPGGWA